MSAMDEADSVLAVVAHGLLGSVSVVKMALLTLDRPDLPAEVRADVLARAIEQTEHMAAVLKDLIRGLPTEVVELLDELSSDRNGQDAL